MITTRCVLPALAVSTLLCAARPARADLTLDFVSPPPPRIDWSERHDAATSKLRSGRTLTIMGLVHMAVGGAVLAADMVSSQRCSSTAGCRNEMGSIPSLVAGSLLVSSGAIFASAGVPMWIVGARDVKRAEIGLTASAGGVRLTF